MFQVLSSWHRAPRKSVCFIAAWSRILVFILQIVFNILPDHKADAFKPHIENPRCMMDDVLRRMFDGFTKWDSQYILYISEHKYNMEQTFAFFPLLPFVIRFAASIFAQLAPFLSFNTCCVICAALINFGLFIGAAVFLFELTKNLFGNLKFAFLSTFLFCFNPASIFFSSCYTESLFSFCVFKAMLLLSNKNKVGFTQECKSTFWFMLAGATRSNGTVNCGFILYYLLKCFVQKWRFNALPFFSMVILIFKSLVYCSVIVFPFLAFNWYGYVEYCTCSRDVDCSKPKWCKAYFPSIYNHVQKDIWGLALFSYYKFKKLPNFILATPVIVLSLSSVYLYLAERKNELINLGLLSSTKASRNAKYFFTTQSIFPYLVHLIFLLVFALLFMHVEVTTRMLMSSTPLIYWTVASFIYNDVMVHDVTSLSFNCWFELSTTSKNCLRFFGFYFLLGILLHCNFLPWT